VEGTFSFMTTQHIMSNNENLSFLLKTAKSQYGKLYYRNYVIGGTEYRIKPQSWLAIVLQELFNRAQLAPLPTPDVGYFKAVVDLMAQDANCWELMNRSPVRITRKDVTSLFGKMERAVETHLNWEPATLARASMLFRRWMAEICPEGTFFDDISRHPIFYKTFLLGRYRPRLTLSDSVDDSSPALPVPPLDATPHLNLKELRASIEHRLDRDAERLIEACITELTKWNSVRTRLRELSRAKFAPFEMQLARTALRKKLTDYGRRSVCEIGPEKFLGACAFLSTQSEAKHLQPSPYWDDFIVEILQSTLDISIGDLDGLRPGHVILLAQRMHSLELIAAFLLLLAYTAWNAGALRVLERSRIRQVKNGYVIQSFKSKTDDDTPEVYLDSEQKGAAVAVELLIWNHSQLRSMGLIAPGEQRLWFTWTSAKRSVMEHQFTSMARPLAVFTNRYNLPRFSFDQIRTHMLVRAGVKTKSLEHVRQRAGHVSISTTGHYFEQVLMFKLGKAINLEYQRRIENTVKWDMEASGRKFEIPAMQQYLDRTILVPIGDGTACANPENPPDQAWLHEGTCDAKRCHVGNGCSRNRIVLNRARLEELFRMEMYFRAHWKRLQERNPDAFEAYHGPTMLFNLILVDYVKKSLFWPDVEPLLAQWGVK
jgi:hypothetical protein